MKKAFLSVLMVMPAIESDSAPVFSRIGMANGDGGGF